MCVLGVFVIFCKNPDPNCKQTHNLQSRMPLPDPQTPLELSPTIHSEQFQPPWGTLLVTYNDEANDQGQDQGQLTGSPAFFDDDVLQTKPGSDECMVENEFALPARELFSASCALCSGVCPTSPRAGVMTWGIKTYGLILWDGILLCCGTLMRSSKTRKPFDHDFGCEGATGP